MQGNRTPNLAEGTHCVVEETGGLHDKGHCWLWPQKMHLLEASHTIFPRWSVDQSLANVRMCDFLFVFIHRPLWPFIMQSIHPSIHPSISLAICFPFCLSIHVGFYPFFIRSIHPLIYLSIDSTSIIHLSIYPSMPLSVKENILF